MTRQWGQSVRGLKAVPEKPWKPPKTCTLWGELAASFQDVDLLKVLKRFSASTSPVPTLPLAQKEDAT